MSPETSSFPRVIISAVVLATFLAWPGHSRAAEFPQAGLAGTWKSADGREQIKIVAGRPGEKWTLSGTLKDWTFDVYDAARGEISFTREPKEQEMDAAIPQPARQQAAGKLKWLLVLVVDAHTDPCRVALSGTLYSGKVEWQADAKTREMISGSEVKVTSGWKEKQAGKGDAPSEDSGQRKIAVPEMLKDPRELPNNLKLEKGEKATDGDIRLFSLMLEDCRTRSAAFDSLIKDRESSKSTVTLILGRGQDNVWVDRFLGRGKNELDLDHIAIFPCRAFDQDPKRVDHWYNDGAQGAPPWACSRCEILAHIIGEADSAARLMMNTPDLNKIPVCHQDGITKQSAVRMSMGLPNATRPTQTLEQRSIEIKYGTGSQKETLTFKDGKMTIEYATGR